MQNGDAYEDKCNRSEIPQTLHFFVPCWIRSTTVLRTTRTWIPRVQEQDEREAGRSGFDQCTQTINKGHVDEQTMPAAMCSVLNKHLLGLQTDNMKINNRQWQLPWPIDNRYKHRRWTNNISAYLPVQETRVRQRTKNMHTMKHSMSKTSCMNSVGGYCR